MKIDLFQMEENQLEESRLNLLRGGNECRKETETIAEKNCSCGCNGPSTTSDNKTANVEGGLVSPGTDVCDSIFKKWTVTW